MEEDWAASTFNVRLNKPHAADVIKKLVASGIESRQWWGRGCHIHPAYNWFPRTPLPITEMLGDSILALPFTLDIKEDDVSYIMRTFTEIVTGL